MATNMLKRSRYNIPNHHNAPGLISVTLINTLNVLVTTLLFNLKRTRNTNFADKLEINSIITTNRNTIAQYFFASGFQVCQIEASEEKG